MVVTYIEQFSGLACFVASIVAAATGHWEPAIYLVLCCTVLTRTQLMPW